MSVIDQVSTHINETLLAANVVGGTEYHGLVRLVTREAQSFPVCEADSVGRAIYPDQGAPLKVYHRLEGEVAVLESPANGYGADLGRRLRYTLSIFGVGTRAQVFNDGSHATWALALAYADALPRSAFSVNSNVRGVLIGSLSIESDDAAVLGAEYKGHDWQGKQLDLVAFRIRATIEADVCSNFCD